MGVRDAREVDADVDAAGREVRAQPQARQMVRVAPLEPHRLPEVGLRAVPALLAEGHLAQRAVGVGLLAVDRAVDPDGDPVHALHQGVGDLEGEGQPPALVLAHPDAVHPGDGIVEGRAEAKEHPARDPAGREHDGAAVEAGARLHAQIVELRLPGPRHRDGPDRPRGRSGSGGVLELPGAVEGQVAGDHRNSPCAAGRAFRPSVGTGERLGRLWLTRAYPDATDRLRERGSGRPRLTRSGSPAGRPGSAACRCSRPPGPRRR
jgi:hypothetical protein